jgi:hypothetical protein
VAGEDEVKFSDAIPDDVDLFPEPGGEPAPPVEDKPAPVVEEPPVEPDKPKPAPAKPAVEPDKPPADKPPEKKDPEPPASLKKMMDGIQERDRGLTEREQKVREAEKWQRQAREFERFQSDIRDNPVNALQRLGVDIQGMLGEQLGLKEPPKKEELLEKRLADLEAQLTAKRKTEEEQEQQSRREAAQRNIIKGYNDLVAAEGEAHPHLKAFSDLAPDLMFEEAQTYAAQTSRWLPKDEAARRAEAKFAGQVERVLEVASKMPQYENWFGKPTNGDSRVETQAQTSRPPQGKTLSQRDTSTPPPAVQPEDLIGASDNKILDAGLAAFQSVVSAKPKK